MTIRDYSTTADDNTSIEGITLADSMLANALDNAIRQQMADSANFLLDIAKPTASTGSANVYALSTGGTVGSYGDKVRLAFRANFSNTGACTINVDTLGAIDLKIYGSSGIADPASGQIQSGGVYDIMYVSAIGDFVVLNPTSVGAGISNVVEDTTPQLGGMLDVNGQSIGDGTLELLKFAEVASAVNEVTITNAITTEGPTVAASGDDTNVTLNIIGKGSGNVDITSPSLIVGSDADGDLYYRGSGVVARLAKGTAGQTLKMNSGATAPEWGASSGQVLLATQDLSASATADFTEFDATNYDSYAFILMNVTPATDDVQLRMRTSSDGGSTYDSGASDYAYANLQPAGDGSANGTSDDTSTYIVLAGSNTVNEGVGSDTSETGVSLTLDVMGPHLTGETYVSWKGGYVSAIPTFNFTTGSGVRRSLADVDAVQFYFESGNIESGTINMYGIKNA